MEINTVQTVKKVYLRIISFINSHLPDLKNLPWLSSLIAYF